MTEKYSTGREDVAHNPRQTLALQYIEREINVLQIYKRLTRVALSLLDPPCPENIEEALQQIDDDEEHIVYSYTMYVIYKWCRATSYRLKPSHYS